MKEYQTYDQQMGFLEDFPVQQLFLREHNFRGELVEVRLQQLRIIDRSVLLPDLKLAEQPTHDDLMVTLAEVLAVHLVLWGLPSQVGFLEVHHQQPRKIHPPVP